MKIKALLSSAFLVFFIININSQTKNGTWRDHLTYSIVKMVAEAGDKIYCATYGGLFSLNKGDNSLQKYSKVNGLSDVVISVIGYSEQFSTLLIGYDNCNIDLIRNDSIYNIPDIKIKPISGEKKIYHVIFNGSYAYLSTSFGIIVVDLQKKEIKDTYQFGELGGQIKVNATAFDGINIYAATDKGIYRADINSPNLVDYNFWYKLQLQSLPISENSYFRSIAYYAGTLKALYSDKTTGKGYLLNINGDSWTYWDSYKDVYLKQLSVFNNYLHITNGGDLDIYNQNLSLEYKAYSGWPDFCLYDKDKILWIADIYSDGLIKSVNGVYERDIAPNGPKYPDVGEIVYSDDRLWVAAGNESSKWSGRGVYLYKDEKWTSFNKNNIPAFENVLNVSEIAVDPNNPDHIFGGSIGYGVVELDVNSNFKRYSVEGGVLRPITNTVDDIRVTGMTYDKKGNLWLITNLTTDPVYVIRPDGKWENIKLKNKSLIDGVRLSDIYANSYGDIWLLVVSTGIISFRENEDGSIDEKMFSVINEEDHPYGRIYTITEDNEGDIWIGTNEGPVVYYKPVIDYNSTSDLRGHRILIPKEGAEVQNGAVDADPLLQFERINCIEIDGANRKWIGTESSGVYLMSEDGIKEIHHFTFANSPLLSDNVVSVAINKKNGEIFFGTDKGIVSFKGQATQGSDEYSNVYVYPNPVRENYEGDITITGLIENSNVKITDVSGNLVFETTSLGGQAIWDGKNFKGKKVYTGVYLVFCSNEDGSKTHVTKLLFIH